MILHHQKIRWLREERGYTLTDFAHKAGISLSFLSEIERGAKQPSIKILEKIANTLNVSKDQLIEVNEDSEGINMGEKIRLLRAKNGISMTDLAQKAAISNSYLSDIERGNVCPAVNTIRRLAEALNVPTSVLLSHSSAIGYKLRFLRDEREMTQVELAQKADVSAGLVGQIEHGKVQPSFKTLEKLAGAFGVSPCYFVLDNENIDDILPVLSPEIRELLTHPNVQAILRLVCNLEEKELKFILNFIQLYKQGNLN